jgi:hypothetical protein
LLYVLLELSEGQSYNSNPRKEKELEKTLIRKLQIAKQLKRVNQTSSAGARNVYVEIDSIFSTFCDL